MKAAIMVAVLFRALDAFRIFDNIYVMTRGAQNTESVSFLTYRQMIEQFELGIGSALSVLLFLSVLLIAFLLVKLFKVDLAVGRGERMMQRSTKAKVGTVIGFIVIMVWCLLPIAWIMTLSLKPVEETATGSPQFLPEEGTIDNYETVLKDDLFQRALFNSFGISLIATTLSVIIATLCAYAIARLEFTGKRFVLSIALAIAMFPVVSLVGPLFDMWTDARALRHVARADHPVHVVHAAAGHLDAVGVLPRDPVGDGAGRAGRRGDVVAGVPQGDRAARRAGSVHGGDPDVLLRLERLRLRHLADVDEKARPVPAALAFFVGPDQFNPPTSTLSAAAVVVTVPIIIIVLLFQRRIVAGLTSGAVKG